MSEEVSDQRELEWQKIDERDSKMIAHATESDRHMVREACASVMQVARGIERQSQMKSRGCKANDCPCGGMVVAPIMAHDVASSFMCFASSMGLETAAMIMDDIVESKRNGTFMFERVDSDGKRKKKKYRKGKKRK